MISSPVIPLLCHSRSLIPRLNRFIMACAIRAFRSTGITLDLIHRPSRERWDRVLDYMGFLLFAERAQLCVFRHGALFGYCAYTLCHHNLGIVTITFTLPPRWREPIHPMERATHENDSNLIRGRRHHSATTVNGSILNRQNLLPAVRLLSIGTLSPISASSSDPSETPSTSSSTRHLPGSDGGPSLGTAVEGCPDRHTTA